MKLADDESPLLTYYFRGHSDDRNTSVLTNRRLVVIYRGLEESFPLSKITAVRVQFQRSILCVILGIVFMLSAIGGGVALQKTSSALQEVSTQSRNSPRPPPADLSAQADMILTIAPILEWVLIPLVLLTSCWLVYFGWRGQTGMQVTYFAGEKTYAVAGRDAKLMEFADRIVHQLS